MKKLLVVACLLTGCSSPMLVTMMPRDSATVYKGQFTGTSAGAGTLSVDLAGVNCTGPAARVASKEVTSTGVAYGLGKLGQAINTANTTSGDSTVKALLTCSNGKAMRCELTGRDRSGGGVCTEDSGRVLDVIVTSK
jgi:hypothetical protein